MMVEALNAGNVTRVGVIIIVALVVLGALLSIIVTALLGRLLVIVVVVVLAIVVWQQRGHVENSFNAHKCDLSATFFGFHLDAPASVKQACNRDT